MRRERGLAVTRAIVAQRDRGEANKPAGCGGNYEKRSFQRLLQRYFKMIHI
jgi:hypothetical protein